MTINIEDLSPEARARISYLSRAQMMLEQVQMLAVSGGCDELQVGEHIYNVHEVIQKRLDKEWGKE